MLRCERGQIDHPGDTDRHVAARLSGYDARPHACRTAVRTVQMLPRLEATGSTCNGFVRPQLIDCKRHVLLFQRFLPLKPAREVLIHKTHIHHLASP